MRVTIDLDTKNQLTLLKTLFNLAYFTGKRTVDILVEETRKGYHLTAYTPLDFDSVIFLRKLLGDDPVRIKLDEKRKFKVKNVLWTVKITSEGRFESRKINPLSLPWFIPRTVRRYER